MSSSILTPLPHDYISKAKSLIKILNNNGDKLQPCLTCSPDVYKLVVEPLCIKHVNTHAGRNSSKQ